LKKETEAALHLTFTHAARTFGDAHGVEDSPPEKKNLTN